MSACMCLFVLFCLFFYREIHADVCVCVCSPCMARYMNYKGCKRKFDVARFVSKFPQARANAASITAAGMLGGWFCMRACLGMVASLPHRFQTLTHTHVHTHSLSVARCVQHLPNRR